MRFDDRLATVLAQPGESARERAIRWRQLVDLVARSGPDGDAALLADALAAIRSDHEVVAPEVRAATVRAIAGRPLPLPLLQLFVGEPLAIAAPLLASLPTDAESIAALRASASAEVRPVLDSLAGRGPDEAPAAQFEPTIPAEAAAPAAPVTPVPSLSEVVARIERLRSTRERKPRAGGETAGSAPALFRWECDPSGEIGWVEGAPRGALVGRSIAVADPVDGVDQQVERAFEVRAAFRDCRLEIGADGVLSGHWMISGVPAFSTADGRFAGYRGIARREEAEEPLPLSAEGGEAASDHDWLREMMHEIRTPLNAIIGFAEIIDGQYFGPAHSRYRERAAQIVGNARSLLDAAEDLDFAARLQSDRARLDGGTELGPFFARFGAELQERAAAHAVSVAVDLRVTTGVLALDAELAERLLRRFTDAVLSATARGERLAVTVEARRGRCEVAVTRPDATMLAGKDELLDPEFTIGDADRAMLGLGFSLRLVNGLVGIAGGSLDVGPGELVLGLPLGKR